MYHSNNLSDCKFSENLTIQYKISSLPYVDPHYYLFKITSYKFTNKFNLNCTTNSTTSGVQRSGNARGQLLDYMPLSRTVKYSRM